MPNNACVCGEINSRNCPVHQNSTAESIHWKTAEDHADRLSGFNRFNLERWIQSKEHPEADLRDYSSLEEEALGDLVFDSLGQAEAFFGGLWTGTKIAKIELRAFRARQEIKDRNRLAHEAWAVVKHHLEGIPGTAGALGAIKAVLLAEVTSDKKGVDTPGLNC